MMRLMKETWLKGFKQMCGMTNGPSRHKKLGGGIEMWKRWLPNKGYITKRDGI